MGKEEEKKAGKYNKKRIFLAQAAASTTEEQKPRENLLRPLNFLLVELFIVIFLFPHIRESKFLLFDSCVLLLFT